MYEGEIEEKQKETTEKNRARIEALRKKQEEYDKFFASSDKFRKNKIAPPKLSKKQSDELSNLVAIEGVKQWREDMKEHPRYKGVLNFKNYMRDVAIPGYFGVGGSISNYFNIGTDASANITSITKDGLPAFYGADLSRNTSLSNLFLSDMPPDPDPSGFDMAVYAAQNLNIFPSLSVLNNLRKGATAAYKQDWRTFYKSMPRFFNPAIEQYYLSKEGAESYLGDPFEEYGPKYFTTRKKVLGAIGFADKEYSDRRKQTYLNNRFETIVKKDRARILQDWQDAIRDISAYKTRKNRTDPKERSLQEVLDADKLIEKKYYDAIRKKEDFNALYGMLGFTTPITQDTWRQVQYNTNRKSYFQFISNGILDGAEKNPAEALGKLKAFENATGNIFPKEDIDAIRNSITLEYERDVRKRRRKANEEMQKKGTDSDISFE